MTTKDAKEKRNEICDKMETAMKNDAVMLGINFYDVKDLIRSAIYLQLRFEKDENWRQHAHAISQFLYRKTDYNGSAMPKHTPYLQNILDYISVHFDAVPCILTLEVDESELLPDDKACYLPVTVLLERKPDTDDTGIRISPDKRTITLPIPLGSTAYGFITECNNTCYRDENDRMGSAETRFAKKDKRDEYNIGCGWKHNCHVLFKGVHTKTLALDNMGDIMAGWLTRYFPDEEQAKQAGIRLITKHRRFLDDNNIPYGKNSGHLKQTDARYGYDYEKEKEAIKHDA